MQFFSIWETGGAEALGGWRSGLSMMGGFSDTVFDLIMTSNDLNDLQK